MPPKNKRAKSTPKCKAKREKCDPKFTCKPCAKNSLPCSYDERALARFTLGAPIPESKDELVEDASGFACMLGKSQIPAQDISRAQPSYNSLLGEYQVEQYTPSTPILENRPPVLVKRPITYQNKGAEVGNGTQDPGRVKARPKFAKPKNVEEESQEQNNIT